MTTWFVQWLPQEVRITARMAAARPWRAPAGVAAGAMTVWMLWHLPGLDSTALLGQMALAALVFMAGARHARQGAQRACQQQLRALAEASHDLRQPVHAMSL